MIANHGPSGPIRVGIVGTGSLGHIHARILTEMPEASVAGFVDPRDEAASEVTSKLNLRRFDSISALGKEIDAAVVATPTTAHLAVASELLEAGVDVLVEKPIAATVADAQKLIDVAKQHGRVLQVGHVERYNPAITAVADHLGQVRYFEAERLGVFVPRSLDVDVLLDLMIHDINLVLSLLRQEVYDIRAVGVPVLTDKVDITNVRLELANGAVANLTASRVSQDRVRKVRFFGSDSYISVDTKEQEVKGYKLVDRSIQHLEITVEKKEPLRAELEAFLGCVRDRSRPIVAGEDGLAAVDLAMRVAAAIDESMRKFRK